MYFKLFPIQTDSKQFKRATQEETIDAGLAVKAAIAILARLEANSAKSDCQFKQKFQAER